MALLCLPLHVASSHHTLAGSPSPSHVICSTKNHPSLISQLHRPQSEFCFSLQQRRQHQLCATAPGRSGRRPHIVAALADGGNLVFGCRIPQHYFATKGTGDTDDGAGDDAWETGSYDIALQNAGIADFNIQTYTSVMPAEAVQLTLEEAKPYFHHGAVLECIMASMNGTKGDRISAGVGRAKVRKIDDKTSIGGYAAEYKGHSGEAIVQELLYEDLQGIFKRRFDATQYEMYDFEYTIEVLEVTKSYGTVLASVCFISFIEPIFQVQLAK